MRRHAGSRDLAGIGGKFRDWEYLAPADIWLRIGLVLAKRKNWVGNLATVGVRIFSFIPKISYWECFLGTKML